MNEPNAEVLAAMAAAPAPAPDADRLAKLRHHASEARDLEAEKEDKEARIKEINIRLQELYFKELVDLMLEAGVPRLSLEAAGNLPEIEFESKPHYRANIPSDWPEEQRKAAFAWLDAQGHGDILKTEVITAFPRGQRKDALAFAQRLTEEGKIPLMKEGVPWATLTAWLKEQFELRGATKDTIPLETLGATVGRVVKIKSKDR